jgi:hypothetical protein
LTFHVSRTLQESSYDERADPHQSRVAPFTWDVKGLGWSAENKPIYDPNATTTRTGLTCKFYTSAGVVGEYVGGGDILLWDIAGKLAGLPIYSRSLSSLCASV